MTVNVESFDVITLLPLAPLEWTFRELTRGATWRSAVVPGCVHADLRRHGVIPDPFFGTNELDVQWVEERDWEYRVVFDVAPEMLTREHVELVADGLDTVATVLLNGQEIARTENMFVGYRWEVRGLLKAKRNELRIVFGSAQKYIRSVRAEHVPPFEFNDPVGGSTRIRKQACQFGWDWAPRLATVGVWRDIRLEAWGGERLAGVRVSQEHTPSGVVIVGIEPEFAGQADGAKFDVRIHFEDMLVASVEGAEGKAFVEIAEPHLWWPHGQGEQPLYLVEVTAYFEAGGELGRAHRRIGLRRIVLDQHADEWGETFQFVVNGRPVFAKGANWIPVDSIVAGVPRERYARDLRAAVAANMNMLRVWGGGIYESEDFYDLCDELGLLVWHDFMFACTLYPSDAAFSELVQAEAGFQVRRLRHHACLALWCGNNEITQLNAAALGNEAVRRGYEKVFHEILPEVVRSEDGVTPYTPSSEWRGKIGLPLAEGEKRGDTHYWEVWHARKPVQDYERWNFRFVSEFGMQSYASTATMARWSPPEDRNLFGPTSENHQKNAQGNQIILDYVSRRYGCPRDQAALVYLSQLNQAYCMQVAVEHFRRITPRCMGTLYWQLNDCWPCASWSSIEHSGRWKALHYAARRFYAPALVSAHIIGEETQGKGNYRVSTVSGVHLCTVYDAPLPAKGRVRWQLLRFDGEPVKSGQKRVTLRYGESVRQLTLDFMREFAKHSLERVYLRYALEVDDAVVSSDTVFFAPPRFLALREVATKVTVKPLSPRRARLTFRSKGFQHRFCFDFGTLAFQANDNFFELYPDEPREIEVDLVNPIKPAALSTSLAMRSLASAQHVE